MQHRLYQDGEINFTLQSPDNKTIAVFSVHSDSGIYHASITDLTKKLIQKTQFYQGLDKQRAIYFAYMEAKSFARSLSPNFEDLTQIKRLEEIQ